MCMQKYEYLIVLFLIYFKCYSFFSTFWTYYSVSTQFSMFKWQLSNRCRIVATLATNWDHRINKSDWIVFQSDPRFFGVRCLKGIIIRPPDREWVDCMDVLYRLETGENRTALSGQHLIPEVAAPYPALDVFEIGATWPGKSGKNSVSISISLFCRVIRVLRGTTERSPPLSNCLHQHCSDAKLDGNILLRTSISEWEHTNRKQQTSST